MADVKKDIWGPGVGRTSITRNYVDYGRSSAIRTFRVKGLAGDRTSEAEAITAVKATIGNFHPDLVGTPLWSLTSKRYGVTKALVHARYRRDNRKTRAAMEKLITIRTGMDSVRWYKLGYLRSAPTTGVFDSFGRPDGDWFTSETWKDETDEAAEPQPYIWKRPKIDIYVFTDLAFDPTPDIFDLINTINTSANTWGDYSFPAETLRFNGAQVDWYEAENDEVRYVTRYHFTAVRGGWVNASVGYEDVSGTDTWVMSTGPTYSESDFTNAFPVGE